MQVPHSLVVTNSYGLGLDETTMLELGGYRQKIKSKYHRFWFMCIWHGMAWRAMGRYIKGKSARGEHGELKCKKYCVYVSGTKSLETLNQRIQIIFIC